VEGARPCSPPMHRTGDNWCATGRRIRGVGHGSSGRTPAFVETGFPPPHPPRFGRRPMASRRMGGRWTCGKTCYPNSLLVTFRCWFALFRYPRPCCSAEQSDCPRSLRNVGQTGRADTILVLASDEERRKFDHSDVLPKPAIDLVQIRVRIAYHREPMRLGRQKVHLHHRAGSSGKRNRVQHGRIGRATRPSLPP